MADISHDIEVVNEGLALLAEQFKGAGNLAALLTSFLTQDQEIEDALYQLVTDRAVDSAAGTQLDNLGTIVGVTRDASDDDEYRLRIKAQIRLNKDSGTIPQLVDLFELLVSGPLITVVEEFPAAVIVRLTGEAISDASTLASILRKAKAGGVRAILEYTNSSNAAAFTLDIGPGLDLGVFTGAL